MSWGGVRVKFMCKNDEMLTLLHCIVDRLGLMIGALYAHTLDVVVVAKGLLLTRWSGVRIFWGGGSRCMWSCSWYTFVVVMYCGHYRDIIVICTPVVALASGLGEAVPSYCVVPARHWTMQYSVSTWMCLYNSLRGPFMFANKYEVNS